MPISRSLKQPKIYNKNAKDGVRGWAKNKPKSRSQRRKLMDLCGPKCFGKPSTLGFPVCPIHIQHPSQCGPDCKGLLAAYTRSRQWRKKHPNIASRVKQSAERIGCKWAIHTKRRSKRRRQSTSHD